MKKITAWDLFLKTRELNRISEGNLAVPINTIAKELAIGTDLAEQYAICLQMLDILQFDSSRKEVTLPRS